MPTSKSGPANIDDIAGWFHAADQWLVDWVLTNQEAQGVRGDLCELGAYQGKSAVLIGMHRRPGEIFTVCDLFDSPAPDAANAEEMRRSYSSLTRATFERNYLGFHDELPVIVEGPTALIGAHVPAGSCRFVHVDASHHYEHVVADIAAARAMLQPDGVVVLDDYRAAHTPGVAAATWFAVRDGGLQPICVSPYKMYATWADPTPVRKALAEWLDSQPGWTWAEHDVAGGTVLQIAEYQGPTGPPATAPPSVPPAGERAGAGWRAPWRLPSIRALRLPTSRAWRLGALTYAACQAVLLFWWVGFYPGTLSYDSVMYLWQVSTSNWTTQHSVLYNGLVWLSLQAIGQLALLTLTQTVAMAGGLAYAVTGLRRLRVPGRWVALAAAAAACLPVVGTFTVYVSKDVAFVICQVWLLGTVARILAARPDPSRRLWLALLTEFVLMGLFRQNAFVVIALTAVLLAAVLRGLRWRVLACAGAAIAAGVVANLAVFPGLGVRPAGTELVLGPVYADIAVAYSHRPGEFTATEKQLMAAVAPLEYWASTANCYNADATVTRANPEFNFAAANQRRAELLGLWQRLVKRMPDEMVQTRLCRGAIAWNPFPGPAHGWTVKIPIAGVERYFGFPEQRLAQSPFRGAIQLAPLSDTAHAAGVFLRRLSDTRSFEWLAWRGATWCYVAYLAVFLFARRTRDVAVLGLAAVVAANQLNVLANNPGQLVRYMVGPIILGLLLLPLAFARREGGAPS